MDFTRENSNIFFGVIYEQRGSNLLRNKEGTKGFVIIPNTPYGVELKDIYLDEEGIHTVYGFLKSLSGYTNVVWFGSRIEPHINDKMILRRGCNFDFELRPKQREIFEELDTYIEKLIVDVDGLRFVSQNKVFRYHFPEDFMSCIGTYWTDGNHLSALGEEEMSRRFNVTSLFSDLGR